MAEESKGAELQKEDRISDLPDSVIHYMLAFLPSTKEAIRTTVLSKRWLNQWTHVPVLVFNSYARSESDEKFSRFIDNTLLVHDCSKIRKFHIQSAYYKPWADPHFNSKLRFAIRKNVEELILKCKEGFRFPDFLFYHDSLVKLQISNCVIVHNGIVKWEHLRELKIEYPSMSDVEIESILTGSPVLELLQIVSWRGFYEPVISSKSLKKLILEYGTAAEVLKVEISCPKLVELKLEGRFISANVVLKDSSSLICATLDFCVIKDDGNLVEILQQLQHVNELTFGSEFIEGLEQLQDRTGLFSPLLNNKILTLENLGQHAYGYSPAGIEYAIRISPVLEKLVIKDVYKTVGRSTKYWVSKGKASNSLLTHLKSVHIFGLGKRFKCEIPHEFVDFILKNAPVLEKLLMLKDR